MDEKKKITTTHKITSGIIGLILVLLPFAPFVLNYNICESDSVDLNVLLVISLFLSVIPVSGISVLMGVLMSPTFIMLFVAIYYGLLYYFWCGNPYYFIGILIYYVIYFYLYNIIHTSISSLVKSFGKMQDTMNVNNEEQEENNKKILEKLKSITTKK